MKKKVIASILAASMAAMALTGCGGGKTTSEAQSATTDETTASAEAGSTADGEEAPDLNQDTKGTTITFWHSMGGVNGEAMDYLVNKFNEENTDGITVEAVYQGEYDDTINKLKSAQIGNMGADLVQIYDIGTRFMIDSGWVIPMQELIDADGYDISQIEPNIAAYYTVNNELYSMPFNSSTPILYYNKDMFDEAGIDYPDGSWTWDEFYDIAEKLTKEDGSQYGFAANPSNEQDTWMNIVYSMGGRVLTDDNKSGFDDPNTIKAMEFVDKCVKNVMPPASTMSETGTDVLFGSGKVAMISQGSWMVSAFKDNDYIKEHCDVARLPKDAETGESVSLYNGLGWAASANTDMPDEAFQLIEWFGSKDMQKKQADLGVTMAAYEGMSDGWVNSVDCFNLQPYMDAMDNIVFRPHTNATLAWWNPMCEELKKPWNDEESMDDACKNIVTIMNDAIAEESY